jgi:hypothetical protein
MGEQNCGNCNFYRACFEKSMLGRMGCHAFPMSLEKDAGDWCGQWKALKKEKSPAPAYVATQIPPAARTHAELTAQVAEILRTKKMSIADFSKILKENGMTNLQELASNLDKIPLISAKINEVLNA